MNRLVLAALAVGLAFCGLWSCSPLAMATVPGAVATLAAGGAGCLQILAVGGAGALLLLAVGGAVRDLTEAICPMMRVRRGRWDWT